MSSTHISTVLSAALALSLSSHIGPESQCTTNHLDTNTRADTFLHNALQAGTCPEACIPSKHHIFWHMLTPTLSVCSDPYLTVVNDATPGIIQFHSYNLYVIKATW